MVPDNRDLPHAPRINEAAFAYYERLGRVRAYVEVNLSDHVTLPKAAAVACLSRSHFCTFFRKAVGVTFMEWLRYMQVRQATRALRACDRPIPQIADAAGFHSVRTFERSFRRWMGVTPQQYRVMHRPLADAWSSPRDKESRRAVAKIGPDDAGACCSGSCGDRSKGMRPTPPYFVSPKQD